MRDAATKASICEAFVNLESLLAAGKDEVSSQRPLKDAADSVVGRLTVTVAALDAVTIVKAADVLNADGGLDPKGSRGKVCEYANPQPFCAQGKPLKKITLLRSSVL